MLHDSQTFPNQGQEDPQKNHEDMSRCQTNGILVGQDDVSSWAAFLFAYNVHSMYIDNNMSERLIHQIAADGLSERGQIGKPRYGRPGFCPFSFFWLLRDVIEHQPNKAFRLVHGYGFLAMHSLACGSDIVVVASVWSAVPPITKILPSSSDPWDASLL